MDKAGFLREYAEAVLVSPDSSEEERGLAEFFLAGGDGIPEYRVHEALRIAFLDGYESTTREPDTTARLYASKKTRDLRG